MRHAPKKKNEGSRYTINRVLMPPREDSGAITQAAKRCFARGYIHPVVDGEGPDLCERCNSPLDQPSRSLFRLQNVATRRRDRINSDKEERQRLGYDLISGLRFAEQNDTPWCAPPRVSIELYLIEYPPTIAKVSKLAARSIL